MRTPVDYRHKDITDRSKHDINPTDRLFQASDGTLVKVRCLRKADAAHAICLSCSITDESGKALLRDGRSADEGQPPEVVYQVAPGHTVTLGSGPDDVTERDRIIQERIDDALAKRDAERDFNNFMDQWSK